MEKYYTWLESSGTLPPGAHLNVTGYSLGGHLATIFTELHRTDPAVRFGEAVTFNAPGRGEGAGTIDEMLTFYRAVLAQPDLYLPSNDDADGVLRLYRSAKGATGPLDGLSIYRDPRQQWAEYATQHTFSTRSLLRYPSNPNRTGLSNEADRDVTQIYGREYPLDRSLVANAGVHGPALAVFAEAQPSVAGRPAELGGTGDYGGGHSIVLLADSVALMRLLSAFDPAQDIEHLNRLFSSASSRTADSTVIGDGSSARAEYDALENALDALRRTLLGPAVSRTEYATGARGFGDLAKREVFYRNITSLSNSADVDALRGKTDIVPINSATALSLARTAKVEFADNVALQMLAPFARRRPIRMPRWISVYVGAFA
jgi:hypothetical protein